MNIKALSPPELAVFEWQYHMCGGFKAALWDAIAHADNGNLMRLRLGFPHEVDGFLAFSREEEWWPRVQRKAQEVA